MDQRNVMKERGLCPSHCLFYLLMLFLMTSSLRSFRIHGWRLAPLFTGWTYRESLPRTSSCYCYTSGNMRRHGTGHYSTDSSQLEDVVYDFLVSRCQIHPGNSLVSKFSLPLNAAVQRYLQLIHLYLPEINLLFAFIN